MKILYTIALLLSTQSIADPIKKDDFKISDTRNMMLTLSIKSQEENGFAKMMSYLDELLVVEEKEVYFEDEFNRLYKRFNSTPYIRMLTPFYSNIYQEKSFVLEKVVVEDGKVSAYASMNFKDGLVGNQLPNYEILEDFYRANYQDSCLNYHLSKAIWAGIDFEINLHDTHTNTIYTSLYNKTTCLSDSKVIY